MFTKRNIIYLLYSFFKNWLGCLALMVAWVCVLPFIINIFKFFGWHEIFASLFWGVAGILIFSWLNQAGAKIEKEKELFEEWLKTVRSATALGIEKERAARKIIASPDINRLALDEIFHELRDSRQIIDACLDKYSELKLKWPAEEEEI
jgi:hypothetical protein